MSAELANSIFGTGVLVLQITLALLLILLLARVKGVRSAISRNILLLGFLVSLGATAGSLIYSNVVGFDPCMLCWFQRIFMYPQAFLFGLALIKKDTRIVDYAILLSAVGILIGLYHYAVQFTGITGLPCPVVGQSASCSRQWVREFGYITIPMMSITSFAAILLFSVAHKLHIRQ
jgi:disulfide bond formation protein DsbB